MTTNINMYNAVINGINGPTTTPLLNIYSDIFIYKDTNQKNLPAITSIPFTAETTNGIATVDPSGGITLINPGIYKIDMEVIISVSNHSEGNNNSFNTMLTTTYFNGSTNTWSGGVPLLYYNVSSTTNGDLTIINVDAPGIANYVGYYNGLSGFNFGTTPPGAFIEVQYKSNNGGEAYGNYMSIHYIINSKKANQKIYYTTQVPGGSSSTLYMGLVTAVVNLTSTNYISI